MPRQAQGVGALLLVVLASLPAAAVGQEVPVPAELQAKLFARILSFDRTLAADATGELLVGVLVQREYRPSLEAGEDFAAAVVEMAPSDPRLRVVLLDAKQGGLDALLQRHDLGALYVTPLRALTVAEVAGAARRLGIRTLTGVPGYVPAGLSTGLGLRDQRPEILINLEAARAEGTDYTAQLLGLARLVDQEH
jgi:hypothetical protein